MFSHPKILFLVSLLFVASIPTYLFKFLIFYHSSLFPFYAGLYQSLGRRSKFYRRLRSNYACLQALLVCRRLLTTHLLTVIMLRLPGKAAV